MPKQTFDAGHLHRYIEKHFNLTPDKLAGVRCSGRRGIPEDWANTAGWSIQWTGNETQADRDAVNAWIATVTDANDIIVPEDVSKYQFKRALLQLNQLDNVIAQVPNLTPEAKLYWEENQRVGRNSILIDELKVLLSLTDTQVDNFFNRANDIDEI